MSDLLPVVGNFFVVALYLCFAMTLLVAAIAFPTYLVMALVRLVRDGLRSLRPVETVSPSLRTTDRARSRAVGALRDSYADGRLDLTELERRTGDALDARTAGELVRLFADLPLARRLRRPPPHDLVVGLALLLFFSTPVRILGAVLLVWSWHSSSTSR